MSQEIIDKMSVQINMEQKMCTDCKKNSKEYYELKLQVRFSYFKDILKVKEEVKKFVFENFKYVNKQEDVLNGFDVYFRNLNQLNKVSKLFNKKFFCYENLSKKIIGHNFLKTKDMFRYTLLINIVDLNLKDRVRVKGEIYMIKAFNKNNLVLIQEETNQKKTLNFLSIKDYLFKLD